MKLIFKVLLTPAVILMVGSVQAMQVQSINKSKTKVKIKMNENDLKKGDNVNVGDNCIYSISSARGELAIGKVKSCSDKDSVTKGSVVTIEDFADNDTSSYATSSNSSSVSTRSRALRPVVNNTSKSVGLGINLADKMEIKSSTFDGGLKINSPVSLEFSYGKLNEKNIGFMLDTSFIFNGQFKEIQNSKYTAIKMALNGAYEFTNNYIAYAGISYPMMFDNTNMTIDSDMGYQGGVAVRLLDDVLIDLSYRVENYKVGFYTDKVYSANISGLILKASYFY